MVDGVGQVHLDTAVPVVVVALGVILPTRQGELEKVGVAGGYHGTGRGHQRSIVAPLKPLFLYVKLDILRCAVDDIERPFVLCDAAVLGDWQLAACAGKSMASAVRVSALAVAAVIVPRRNVFIAIEAICDFIAILYNISSAIERTVFVDTRL